MVWLSGGLTIERTFNREPYFFSAPVKTFESVVQCGQPTFMTLTITTRPR